MVVINTCFPKLCKIKAFYLETCFDVKLANIVMTTMYSKGMYFRVLVLDGATISAPPSSMIPYKLWHNIVIFFSGVVKCHTMVGLTMQNLNVT